MQASASDIGMSRYFQQPVQDTDVFLQPKRHQKRAIPEQAEQGVLRHGISREQIDRFGQYRLTNEQRCIKFLDQIGGPTVVSFGPVKKSDQRSGINDGAHRAQSP